MNDAIELPAAPAHRSSSTVPSVAAALFPRGHICALQTHDFDEMARTPAGWQLEIQQLGKGRFRAELFMVHTARLQLAHCAWTPGILIRGDIPAGAVMLALPLRSAASNHHCRWQISEDSMSVRYDDEGIDFHSAGPMDMFVVTADRALVEQYSAVVVGRSLQDVRREREIAFQTPTHKRRQLAGLMSAVRSALAHDASHLRTSAFAETLESTVLGTLLSGVRAREPELSAGRRRHLAHETQQLLRESLDRATTIFDLCQTLAVPERTLHLAFREHFGTTPKAYLKALRLNAARRDLRQFAGHTTVTEVAIRRGFEHLSWFAHDYRELFGETPMQTLRQQEIANQRGSSGFAVCG